MQKYNIDIPGWMSERELTILHTLAGYVPENGSILEIGCFLGLSTTALYRGKLDSVSLDVVDSFCIDPSDFKNMKFSLLHATEYTDFERINQIITEQGWQAGFKYCIGDQMYYDINLQSISSELYNKSKKFNLIFIDATHEYESVEHDILKYVTDDDLLMGDDFSKLFPGVILAVGKNRNGKTLIVFEKTKLWALVPRSGYWRDVFKDNNLLFVD